jgi:hypothetical protein
MRRTVGQLIEDAEDAWPTVLGWIQASARPVAVEPVVGATGEATLFALQVTTRSPMGAIALRCGGIVIDHGWLRILGAGGGHIGDGLRGWNGLDGAQALQPPLHGALIVAYDAMGGFFVLNGGAWPGDLGSAHYLAPDTYERQDLGLGYSGLLQFTLSDRLDRFYGDLRWPGWEDEVAALAPDSVIHVYPPLGTEPTPIVERSRRPIPAREAWTWYRDFGDQIRGLPDGATVRMVAERRPR